jgi:hypothetical protein
MLGHIVGLWTKARRHKTHFIAAVAALQRNLVFLQVCGRGRPSSISYGAWLRGETFHEA